MHQDNFRRVERVGGISIAVCVPVRNEEQAIGSLVRALAAQKGPEAASTIHCFYLDNCTDRSAAVIRAEADRRCLRTAIRFNSSSHPPSAGFARQGALQIGLDALAGYDDGILLTTDADSVPEKDWLSRNCNALCHADVVTGSIEQVGDGLSDAHERVRRYFDRLHVLRRNVDPVKWEATRTHHYAAGASMAFKKDVYERLGGFSGKARGEDAEFINEARWQGLRVRHDAAVVVHTSTRRNGRVPGGFAEHLRDLDEPGRVENLQVVDPRVALTQYRHHALARLIYNDASLDNFKILARSTRVDYDVIASIYSTAANEKAFAMRVVPSMSGAAPIDLAEAEKALDRLTQHDLTSYHR